MRAELADRRIDHALSRRRRSDTSAATLGDARSGRRGLLKSPAALLQLLFPARADHDVRAFGNQRFRRGQSQTATPAGDDRDLTGQPKSI